VPQLTDHSLHRRRHKRRRIFRSRRRHHDVRLVRFLCALKKTAEQKNDDSHDGQYSDRRAQGDFPNALRGLGLECCERHRLNRPRIGMNLSAVSAADPWKRKKTQTPQSAPQFPKKSQTEGDTGWQSATGSDSRYQSLAGWLAPQAAAPPPLHTW